VIETIDAWIRPLLPPAIADAAVPGLGLVIVVAALILLGAIAANVAGRWLIDWGDALISRVPVIRSVYKPLKQVFETAMSPQGGSFREVVMFEYPRPGLWVLGFVMGPATNQVRDVVGDDALNLFLPTTPNLYSGFLLLARRSEVRSVEMSVEEAIKYVASAGLAVQPARIKSTAASRSNR
jgi:uncharacterized membrane protein